MENVEILLPYTFFDELRKNILDIVKQQPWIRKAPSLDIKDVVVSNQPSIR